MLSRVTHDTRLHRQGLDLTIELAVAVVQLSYLAQEGYFLVDVILDLAVEHLELLHNLFLREDLGIFPKGGVEALELDQRIFIQLNLLIPLLRWVEHVVVDVRGYRSDTIDTPYALHESGSIPGRVVVDDDVGAM